MQIGLNVVMLVVDDVARSVAFYQALGFRKERGGGSAALLAGGACPLALLARGSASMMTGRDPSRPEASPPLLLLHSARDRAEVDACLAAALAAGARVVKAAADNAWGGYQAAFADPDGHVWSVGFNPDLYRA